METQYRPIDIEKDRPQEGDEYFSISEKWVVRPHWVDEYNPTYKYRRPVNLDLENGKYRIVTNEEAKTINGSQYFSVENWYPCRGEACYYLPDYIYRAPVEAEKEPEVTKEEAFTDLKNDVYNKYIIDMRNILYRMKLDLDVMFPSPKEKVEQCTCTTKRTEVPGMLLLYPKRECPVKVHADHSQLQGSKREIELPKEKAPFVFPSYEECKSKCDHRTDHSLTVYLYLEAMYHKYLKSTCI